MKECIEGRKYHVNFKEMTFTWTKSCVRYLAVVVVKPRHCLAVQSNRRQPSQHITRALLEWEQNFLCQTKCVRPEAGGE